MFCLFRRMQYSRGDRASPSYIKHLMVTCAADLESASRVHCSTEFIMKALNVPSIPVSMCGTESGLLLVDPDFVHIHLSDLRSAK